MAFLPDSGDNPRAFILHIIESKGKAK